MRVSDLDSKLAFKKCLLVWEFSCGAGVQDPAWLQLWHKP